MYDDSTDDWRPHAACRNHPPEMFYPSAKGLGSINQVARAAAICINCPVFMACKDYADSHGEQWGVWAGMDYGSPEMRKRRTVRTNRIPALRCGTEAGAARHRRRNEPVCRACLDGAAEAARWRAKRETV